MALVGAGFIAFTILNALLKLGVRLTIIEIAPIPLLPTPYPLPHLARAARRDVRPGVRLQAIEQVDGRRRLLFAGGEMLDADVVIMATGIRPNLDWLEGSPVAINRGIVVDDHQRTTVPNIYAAGDVAGCSARTRYGNSVNKRPMIRYSASTGLRSYLTCQWLSRHLCL